MPAHHIRHGGHGVIALDGCVTVKERTSVAAFVVSATALHTVCGPLEELNESRVRQIAGFLDVDVSDFSGQKSCDHASFAGFRVACETGAATEE